MEKTPDKIISIKKNTHFDVQFSENRYPYEVGHIAHDRVFITQRDLVPLVLPAENHVLSLKWS
ncbi:hypothetical protein HZS_1378 [Henneguya salminicola]|nr:hypothetical protein HZS_1378 [Henneguya salminicola]